MDAREYVRLILRLAEVLAFLLAISTRMPPGDLRILEVPARSDASRYHRRCVKKKNKRTREQWLLVSSELDADQERQRVAAARADHRDRAAVFALADRERLRAGCAIPVLTQPASGALRRRRRRFGPGEADPAGVA